MTDGTNVLAFRRKRALPSRAALEYLRKVSKNDVIPVDSIAEIAAMLGWTKPRTWKAFSRWRRNGRVTVDETSEGRLLIRIMPDRRPLEKGRGRGVTAPRRGKGKLRTRPTASDAAALDKPAAKLADNSARTEGVRDYPLELDKVAQSDSRSSTYARHEISDRAPDATPPAASESASVRAENTSTAEASPAVSERLPEYTSTAVERTTERPVWRRGGGGVSSAGGGGFDAVAAFGRASWAERILILIAAGLSGTTAYMSVTGMVVMYPFEPVVIMVFGGLIEAAKFFGFGVLAAGWRWYGGFSRLVAASLLLVAAIINASGVYGRLIADHVGPAADRTATYTTQDAGQGAKVDVAQARVQDFDRRISQIDDAIAAATKRGRTNGAMVLAEKEKRNRAELAGERDKANQELANLRAGRTSLGARHQEAEASSTPVKYAAALFEDFGLLKPGTDPEKLMRWISFMILLVGDPLALALMWTVNSRGRRGGA